MCSPILQRKVKISGILTFETAFRIGSGEEGELATDLGVLRERDGRPILPGSSLKGNFRTMCERLAEHLGLDACLLGANAIVQCVTGDNDHYQQVNEELKKKRSEENKLAYLKDHTCDVCRLFGSPLQASRIFFGDGELLTWSGSLQVRDGVCIDRDSETARDQLKFDYEVVPQGAQFKITIDLENPDLQELALVAAALAEWENGCRLGGFTSRGLGKAKLSGIKVEQVDYTDREQLKNYLLDRQMTPDDTLLASCLQAVLNQEGGADAEATH